MQTNNISILSVAQRCGVTIHKTSHYYVAHCPFHGQDKTPSLTFYPHNNSWVCFGRCQGKNGHRNGGGVIQFVQQYFNYDFRQTLEWLESNFGEGTRFEVKPTEPPKLSTLGTVPLVWVEYWHSMLKQHRDYFHKRGFNDTIIDTEQWGWDGQRYTIPVWEGQPGQSDCSGVRLRRAEGSKGQKYLGLKNYNQPGVWGKGHCKGAQTILGFAGELDAALANQDGFPSFSVVNGINALDVFPKDWPELWFPNSKYLIAVYDKKEESFGGRLANQWNRFKGTMTAQVFHWDLGDYKDYGEFRQQKTAQEFLDLMSRQNLTYFLR